MEASVKAEQSGAITIETPRPRPVKRQRIGPGVEERTTCKLLVRYEMDLPPIFDLSATRSTAVKREFGYKLVGAIEKIRVALPMAVEQPIHPNRPGKIRIWLRKVRAALAVLLLLPDYELPAEDHTEKWQRLSPFGFEASRRLFHFEDYGNRALLVCHILAERHGGAAESRLNEFALLAGKQASSFVKLPGQGSELSLYGRQTARFGRRRYWEIIIGAAERFPHSQAGPDDVPTGHQVLDELSLDDVSAAERGVRDYRAVPMPSREFLQGVVERSKIDWNFVVAEIKQAESEGEELDDEFVQRLAKRRFAHARREFPEEQPGATYESSLEVVRDILALHLHARAGGSAA